MTISEKIVKQFLDIEPPYSDSYVESWIEVKELAEAIDAAVAKARREALEEACKVECVLCREGEPLIASEADNLWRHKVRRNGTPLILPCNATQIRELMEEVLHDN